MRADASPSIERALIKFRLTGIPEGVSITSATLRMYVVNYSRQAGIVHAVEGDWSEMTVTWANAPAVGNKIAEVAGPAAVGTWKEADVTSAVTGNGDVNIYVVTEWPDGVWYSAREAGNNPATLVVHWAEDDPTSTPAPTVTPTPGPAPTPTPTLTLMPTPTPISTSTPSFQPEPPIQAAFFYPWFPNAWKQGGVYPYTNYTPSLGFYDSKGDTVIDEQLRLAARAHIEAFISSWWGQGHHTDTAFQHILSRSERSDSPYPNLRWAVYYEPEGQGDPTVSQIFEDLQYLADNFFLHRGYLRLDGRPVVFVFADAADGPGMADRWAKAKAQFGGNVYVVLKVYPGYRDDPNQPDSWHQYGPAVAYDSQLPYSVTVSPGFWKVGEEPRLSRDPARFQSDVQRMAASGAAWQLVTAWNEWGEGTSVEPAAEFGDAYIDILCGNLPGTTDCHSAGPAPTPTPTPAPSPTPTPPCPDASPQGPNDSFACAIVIPEPLPYANSQSTVGTTFEAGDPSFATCALVDSSVWYTFTASSAANLQADTVGSDYDTEIIVYQGTSLGTLSEAACDNDSGPGRTSLVTFSASAGQTYYFLIDGSGGATGNLVFNLQESIPTPTPTPGPTPTPCSECTPTPMPMPAPSACSWSASAVTGWNNLAFLGTRHHAWIAITPGCLTRPAGTSVQAMWRWIASSHRWIRNLYFLDGTSSMQITTVNDGETFWILIRS